MIEAILHPQLKFAVHRTNWNVMIHVDLKSVSINTHFGTDLDDEVSYNNIKRNKGKTILFSGETETEKWWERKVGNFQRWDFNATIE